MNNPSIRARKIIGLSVAPVAILIAGALVWQSSYAAFSTTTRNAGNSWSAGSVALTDDDKGAAAFTAENLIPGATGQKCIVVTSNASVPGVVKTYVSNLSASGHGLENQIRFTLESGSGGSFDDCTGFVADGSAITPATIAQAAATTKDYASGGHAWTTTGVQNEQKSYRANWTFDVAGLTQQQVDALQGATVSADLVWELQTAATN